MFNLQLLNLPSRFIHVFSALARPMILPLILASSTFLGVKSFSFIRVRSIVCPILWGLLAVTGSACRSMDPSLQSPTLPAFHIESVSTEPIPPIYGEVPVLRLGRFLVASGHLTDYPQSSEPVFIDGPADIFELNAQLAYYGYRVVGTRLIQLSAHHRIESPDALGRPTTGVAFVERRQLRLHVEFMRVGVNADFRNPAIAASAQVQRFNYLTSSGVEFSVGNTSERAFSESIIIGDTGSSAVEGRTVFREAGLTFTGLIGLVPPYSRISGNIEVSSFLGSGVERAAVDIPVEIDSVLGRWSEVAIIDAADINAGIAFRSMGWQLDAGAERIVVRVRVEPVVLELPYGSQAKGSREAVGHDRSPSISEAEGDTTSRQSDDERGHESPVMVCGAELSEP